MKSIAVFTLDANVSEWSRAEDSGETVSSSLTPSELLPGPLSAILTLHLLINMRCDHNEGGESLSLTFVHAANCAK